VLVFEEVVLFTSNQLQENVVQTMTCTTSDQEPQVRTSLCGVYGCAQVEYYSMHMSWWHSVVSYLSVPRTSSFLANCESFHM
jgi:hypothetical protein